MSNCRNLADYAIMSIEPTKRIVGLRERENYSEVASKWTAWLIDVPNPDFYKLVMQDVGLIRGTRHPEIECQLWGIRGGIAGAEDVLLNRGPSIALGTHAFLYA